MSQQEILDILTRHSFDAFFASPQAALASPITGHIVKTLLELEELRAGAGVGEPGELDALRADVSRLNIEAGTAMAVQLDQANEIARLQNELIQRPVITGSVHIPQPQVQASVSPNVSAPQSPAKRTVAASSTGSSRGSATLVRGGGVALPDREHLIAKYKLIAPDLTGMIPVERAKALKKFNGLVSKAREKEAKLKTIQPQPKPKQIPTKVIPTAQPLASSVAPTPAPLSIPSPVPPQVIPTPMPDTAIVSMPSGLQLPQFLQQSEQRTQAMGNNGALPPMPVPQMNASSMFPAQYNPQPMMLPAMPHMAQAQPQIPDHVAGMLDGLLD